jgi:hypothetical protein
VLVDGDRELESGRERDELQRDVVERRRVHRRGRRARVDKPEWCTPPTA